MEEIQVGEYVRTAEGNIGQIKITEVDLVINGVGELTYRHWIEDFGGCRVIYEKIKKHSKNIIDLIEVGDYVNGYKVEKKGNGLIYVDYCWDCNLYTMVTKQTEDIKSIVTKEQFEAMKYKLEE